MASSHTTADNLAIRPAFTPSRLTLSYTAAHTVMVAIGEMVAYGAILANDRDRYLTICAPFSGRIANITNDTITLTPAHNTAPPNPLSFPLSGANNSENLSKPLPTLLANKGIVGMGGAGFPTLAKLESAVRHPIRHLIINGCQCEPDISSDHALMTTHAAAIWQGAHLVAEHLNIAHTHWAITEEAEHRTAHAIRTAQPTDAAAQIHIIAPHYSNGHEHQLVATLFNKAYPKSARLIEHGFLVMNVATLFAMAQAATRNAPLTQRVVTLATPTEHINIWALNGTPIGELLSHVGVTMHDNDILLRGGVMMGEAIENLTTPIGKTDIGFRLLPQTEHLANPEPSPTDNGIPPHDPCIWCGACQSVCPVNLLPDQLYWHTQAHNIEKSAHFGLTECIECGHCATVCPSHIPLVAYFKQGKKEAAQKTLETNKTAYAKWRFDNRAERLTRARAEHEAKLAAMRAKAKARLNDTTAPTEATAPTANHTDTLTTAPPAIAKARARAAALQSMQQKDPR